MDGIVIRADAARGASQRRQSGGILSRIGIYENNKSYAQLTESSVFSALSEMKMGIL